MGGGGFFYIQLSDGTFTIGQVVGKEVDALNSAICALFSLRFKSVPKDFDKFLTDDDLIAVLFVTRDLLDSGTWQIFSSKDPFPTTAYLNVNELRVSGILV